MRSISSLLVMEIIAIIAWLVLAGLTLSETSDRGTIIPLDASVMGSGTSQERWYGVFFQDQHTGFTVTRTTPSIEGGAIYESRSHFRFATFGQLHDFVQASTALTDAEGRLVSFDFFTVSNDIRLSARGEIVGQEIIMEIDQMGETSRLSFPIDKPPQVDSSLEDVIRRTELSVGKRLEVPFFDPLTMAEGTLTMKVDDIEVFDNGEEAYWLTQEFSGFETRILVTPSGATLREESPALGVSKVRMTAAEAQDVPTAEEPVDLIAMTAVRLRGRIPNPREARKVQLKIIGVPNERIVHQPPLQTVEGNVVTVDMPLTLELPVLPIEDLSEPEYLAPTLTIPSAHPEIRQHAKKVVGDLTGRRKAAEVLVRHVYEYVAKVPMAGVPNGLEVLRSARGDCNEHTALYVSLARSLGIPARIAAGVVYSDRLESNGSGAFYYHAWPEVRLGGPTEWVPVDPTFGQFPADATHIKLVEGDLDRQIEIMAVMGRLAFDLVEAR